MKWQFQLKTQYLYFVLKRIFAHLCTGGHRDYHDDQSQHVSYEHTGDHQDYDDHYQRCVNVIFLIILSIRF